GLAVAARRAHLGGCTLLHERTCGTEARVRHSERAVHSLLEKGVELLASRGLHDEAEHVCAQVAVDYSCARLASERRLDHCLTSFRGGVRNAPEVASGGQPRLVREQLPHGNAALLTTGEVGDVRRNRCVQPQPAFFPEDHRGRGGCNDLGERGEVVDGFRGRHHLRTAGPVQVSETLLVHGVALAADHDGCARIAAGGDAARHDAIDYLQAFGRHPRFRRRTRRQAVTRECAEEIEAAECGNVCRGTGNRSTRCENNGGNGAYKIPIGKSAHVRQGTSSSNEGGGAEQDVHWALPPGTTTADLHWSTRAASGTAIWRVQQDRGW